ncbi:hypothetical protein ACHAXA_005952 [Cyclostephanos tholiformis]|uniref:Nucleoporin Nup133/Nup155-like C-terminal domain-containing protein n=1 Tax=Cyclostephanos tholiformis TaxID=382380 RepID=A0ABD3SEN0_9STRA
MTYESSPSSSSSVRQGKNGEVIMNAAIDDYFDGSGTFELLNDGTATGGDRCGNDGGSGALLLSGGKRLFSALTFGSLDERRDHHNFHNHLSRSRKCRRINHTSAAPSLVTSVVPGAIINAASSIFGSAIDVAARDAGPIVSILIDEERLCLYTLGARGVICSYDICPPANDRNVGGGVAATIASPRLASVFDSVASAKLYLESVSCGRMYPPTTTHNVALGMITFPGGTSSAQAGVGGMEGARDVLKRHEQEERIMKAGADGVIGKGGARNRPIGSNNTAGILHPVSIHLVPAAESKSLTLVAITGGGLRYYLSSLTLSYINSAQAMRVTNVNSADSVQARMRPGRKMIFCHVRAPPPYTSSDGNDGFRFELAPSAVSFLSDGVGDGGLPPGIHGVAAGRIGAGGGSLGGNAGGDVVKGSYGSGVFVLALNIERKKSSRNTPSSGGSFFANPSEDGISSSPDDALGDVIVVAMPDFAARVTNQSNSSFSLVRGSNIAIESSTTSSTLTNAHTAPGGISETILLPMGGFGRKNAPVLPGGRTYDIVTNAGGEKSTVVTLFVNSETPTDNELQVGLMPSFIPQEKLFNKSVLTSSSALTVSCERGRGIISSALSTLSSYLRSGQEFGYQVGTVSKGANGLGPSITYRVSARHGCGLAGFSTSAGEMLSASQRTIRQRISTSGQTSNSSSAKSARLPTWLLRPTAAPLNYQASQHLLLSTSDGTGSSRQNVLILNAGGLHFFSNSSLINNLATILLRATNLAKDAMVKNVFLSYGYAEGCAMCFALATCSSSSVVLRNKAVEAALCYANRPLMKLTGPSAGEGMDPISSYTFQPSSLYEGLVRIFSRLLRPFWYKPAVVVTEGRPIHSKSAYAKYYSSLPAKVELLLDDSTLSEIRRPLILLQNLMKNTFVPAVQTIPGVLNKDRAGADAMEVDEAGHSTGDGGLITRAMQHQSRSAATAQMRNNSLQAQIASAKELQTCAFRTEDRNMHSLYRLLSRCVQMLNLISCLRHAHEIPALPEVQWGLLHGLTFYQLVSTHEGQERIETLLNTLVSQGDKIFGNGFSTDGDIFAETLSHQCYLFFSSASRLTYLGFRSANDALSRPYTSPQRVMLSNQAASYLRAASRHWYAPALVAGRLASKITGQSWEDVATNAKKAGSPLALAADILMELRNVEGLADVCLICASNFGGSKVPRDERKECREDVVQDMFGWERGLYHRPPISGNGADSRTAGAQAIVAGIDITASDALHTCHGIIFHHISRLLKDGNESNQRLAVDLVATCAASSDVKFLHSLYEHLLATNEQIALRIDSSSLEDWLLNEKMDINLLWNYYSFHGRHILAGDIMWKKAVDTEEKISLDKRIECLTRAANSFSSALDANHSAFNTRGLVGGGFPRGVTSLTLQEQRVTVETLRLRNDQIQEQLDVATIQKRVLTTISQSQNADLEPAKIDALKFTLVNISDLYNDYACPLNLFDVCLLIFETCRRNDFDTINMLWKSIICEEILPCQTNSCSVVGFLTRLKQGTLLEEEAIVYGDGAANSMNIFETGEWISRLKNRVTTLGKELFGKGADYTFPIDLVVRELEGTAVDNLNLYMLDESFLP